MEDFKHSPLDNKLSEHRALTIAACCDVLEDSRAVENLQQAIGVCHQLQFDAVELSLPHVLRSKDPPEKIYDWCRDLGLTICGIHNALPNDFTIFDDLGNVRPELTSHLLKALELAGKLDAPLVTVGIGSSRRIPCNHSSEWASAHFLHALQSPLEDFAKQEIHLSLEIISSHTAGFFNSAQETLHWVEQINSLWIGITCDTFQSLREGLEAVSEVRIALPRLAHLHLAEKDRRPPGRGDMDFGDIFRVLDLGGYNRAISIELKTPSASYLGTSDPLSDLKQGLLHIKECLRRTMSQ